MITVAVLALTTTAVSTVPPIFTVIGDAKKFPTSVSVCPWAIGFGVKLVSTGAKSVVKLCTLLFADVPVAFTARTRQKYVMPCCKPVAGTVSPLML